MSNNKIINVRNEVDRYGFSNIIAKKLNYKFPPKSYANWLHGWVWLNPQEKIVKPNIDKFLGYPKKNNYNVTTIVSNNIIKKSLEDHGFINVISGGMPFMYTEPNENISVKKDTLLVILPHSVSYYKWNNADYKNFTTIFERINSLKENFKQIDCLVFYDDFKKKTFDKLISKHELKVICGARPNVLDSLVYIRSIFEKYKYVTSFCLGSGLLYSMFCKGRVSIIEPIFEHSLDFWRSDPYLFKYQELIKVYEYMSSRDYIYKNFNFLIKDNPIDAKENYDWAKKTIGYEYKIEYEKLREILSWTTFSKINVANKYLARKLNNFF